MSRKVSASIFDTSSFPRGRTFFVDTCLFDTRIVPKIVSKISIGTSDMVQASTLLALHPFSFFQTLLGYMNIDFLDDCATSFSLSFFTYFPT